MSGMIQSKTFFPLLLLLLLLLAIAVIVGTLFFASQKSAPISLDKEAMKIPPMIRTETLSPLTMTGSAEKNCMVVKIKETVQGNSMNEIFKDGQEITILRGYYHCNEVKRDDIVIYPYAGNPIPIVKSVKAVPGDRFELKKDKMGYWNIVVNGKILVTSDNTPYALPETKSKMLALYADSYKNIVPEDAYIILGNLPGGTLDSTQFGLVNKVDFIGKAE